MCKLGEALHRYTLIMINKKCIAELYGCRLYPGLRLDCRLRLWAPTSTSRAISAVAKLVVSFGLVVIMMFVGVDSGSLRSLDESQ